MLFAQYPFSRLIYFSKQLHNIANAKYTNMTYKSILNMFTHTVDVRIGLDRMLNIPTHCLFDIGPQTTNRTGSSCIQSSTLLIVIDTPHI